MDLVLEHSGERPAPAPPGPPLLEVRGVAKSWPGVPAPVLDDVSLTVGAGEVVAITGRNGVGKTTLLRIASGLLTPDRGDVRIGGLDPERHRTECQALLGYLSAGNTGLYGRLTVEQHLEFWARLALLPRSRRAEAKAQARADFALDELGGKRVDRLSMGQRQRVRIALAFLHAPTLILLDEPRTSLDDEGAALLAGAVKGLVARGGGGVVCAPKGEDSGIPFDRRQVISTGAMTNA